MINIGSNPADMWSIKDAIMATLSSPNADTTKVAALEALKSMTKVENVTIQDCTFHADGTKEQA